MTATVQVRLFAALREQAGWSARDVALQGGVATPLTIWEALGLGADPVAQARPMGVRVAINQQFAGWDTPLRDGDELAFLPPISGG